MDETRVLDVVRGHFETQFPKVCVSCGRRYANLPEYLTLTTTAGDFVSYDAAEGSRTPILGGVLLSNCPCGTTLALTTDTLPFDTRRDLLLWVLQECERRAVAPAVLMHELTARFRTLVLSA